MFSGKKQIPLLSMKLINVLNQSISYRLALSALLPSPTLVAATDMGPLAHKNTDANPNFP